MTPQELAALIRMSLLILAETDRLAIGPDQIPADINVERPRVREHGDWSTNAAMRLGKKAGMPPRELGALLAEALENQKGIASAEVAGPGFVNIRLSKESAGELAGLIVNEADAYGRSEVLAGQHFNLEYVSANPTGPIHIGGARWAAYA